MPGRTVGRPRGDRALSQYREQHRGQADGVGKPPRGGVRQRGAMGLSTASFNRRSRPL